MDYFFEAKSGGMNAYESDNLDFGAHLHDYAEIGYMLSGTCNIFIEDKLYPLKQGDFFVIFPNQIHRYDASKNLRVYLMIFSTNIIPEFSGTFSKKIPKTPIVNGDTSGAISLFELFLSEYKNASSEIIRGFTLAITGLLFKNMKFEDLDAYNISTLKNILIYCNENYTKPITADKTAAALYISRSHLAHVFKNKLGSTFKAYISSKRINHACMLLESGNLSVTETAFASGFNSVRTFNRAFAKQMGCTPKEYKKGL